MTNGPVPDQTRDLARELAAYERLRAWLVTRAGLHPAAHPDRVVEQLGRSLLVAMHDGGRPFAVNGQPILFGRGYRWVCPRDGWAAADDLFVSFLADIDRHLRDAHR